MKGYRFYEEYRNKRKGVTAGNVVAVLLDQRGKPYYHYGSDSDMVDAFAGIFEWPNSAPASTSVSLEWLRSTCKRVTEKRAREVHPSLFAWLDSFDKCG